MYKSMVHIAAIYILEKFIYKNDLYIKVFYA